MFVDKPYSDLTLDEFSQNLSHFIKDNDGDLKLMNVIIKITEQYKEEIQFTKLSENYYKRELIRLILNYIDINYIGKPNPEWLYGIDELWKGFNLVE